MAYPKITYRKASERDNKQLLELTRKSGMKGQIALRTDRDPDFFALVRLRGPGAVFVALDDDNIVGSISVTEETVWIHGQKHPLFYISDFKVSPSHRNQGIGFKLTQQVVGYLETKDADFAMLHVAKGNSRPFVFFSDRGNYPDFDNIGTFTVYQYLGKKSKKNNHRFTFQEVKPTDEVLNFINSFYKNYQLAPYYTRANLEGTQLLGVYEGESLKAVMGIGSLDKLKQNVVLKIPLYLKLFRGFMNILQPLMGTVKMPGINQPIRMLYLKLLALDEMGKDLTYAIFSKLEHEAYEQQYPFISIGLHENDPLQKIIPQRRRITFRSTGMLVSMKRSNGLITTIKEGYPFKDFSTV